MHSDKYKYKLKESSKTAENTLEEVFSYGEEKKNT